MRARARVCTERERDGPRHAVFNFVARILRNDKYTRAAARAYQVRLESLQTFSDDVGRRVRVSKRRLLFAAQNFLLHNIMHAPYVYRKIQVYSYVYITVNHDHGIRRSVRF